MDLFVVGDVHGCYHTFKEILDRFWNPETEKLVQLGDLIDKGNYTPQTLQFAWEVKALHGENAVFIKGNHEFELMKHAAQGPNDYWLRQCGIETLAQLRTANMEISAVTAWIKELPLVWENEHLLISHAGIALEVADPYQEEDSKGVLWNRSPLKHIGKLQIIGHTPCVTKRPEYEEASHSWNIDTGAFRNHGLSAIRVTPFGEVLEIVHLPTIPEDVKK